MNSFSVEWFGRGVLPLLPAGVPVLYVTVYGGRTRKVGILLGEGYDIVSRHWPVMLPWEAFAAARS